MGIYIIPSFNHSANDVVLAQFDDEPGQDILFVGDDRSWLYLGQSLSDWGDEFVGGQAVAALDLDNDGDNDFLVGRSNATNLAFKGGPIRVVTSVTPGMFELVAETDGQDAEMIDFDFSGNGTRFGQLNWSNPWLYSETTEYEYHSGMLGASWFIDAFADGLSAGTYSDLLVIKTNDPENEKVEIPVSFVVTAAEVEVNTTTIIETVGLNGQKTVNLTVSNTGTASVWVTPSEDSSWISLATAPFSLLPGESKNLAITLMGASENGTANGQITLTTNKTYLAPIEIQVSLTTTGFQIFLPMVVKP